MGGCLQRVLRNMQDRRYGFMPYAAICVFALVAGLKYIIYVY